MEPARMSLVDINGHTTLDVIIRPTHSIIDANTHFTGLSREQIESAADDFESARNQLLAHVNADTILVGHSLENDLRAMKLVHDKVVDTSILFQHRSLGYKPALRDLALQQLSKVIRKEGV